jgi:hypothetical protein
MSNNTTTVQEPILPSSPSETGKQSNNPPVTPTMSNNTSSFADETKTYSLEFSLTLVVAIFLFLVIVASLVTKLWMKRKKCLKFATRKLQNPTSPFTTPISTWTLTRDSSIRLSVRQPGFPLRRAVPGSSGDSHLRPTGGTSQGRGQDSVSASNLRVVANFIERRRREDRQAKPSDLTLNNENFNFDFNQ